VKQERQQERKGQKHSYQGEKHRKKGVDEAGGTKGKQKGTKTRGKSETGPQMATPERGGESRDPAESTYDGKIGEADIPGWGKHFKKKAKKIHHGTKKAG